MLAILGVSAALILYIVAGASCVAKLPLVKSQYVAAEEMSLPELETGTKTIMLTEGQRSEPVEHREDYRTTVDYDAPVLVQRYKRKGRDIVLIPSQPELRLPGKSYLNMPGELYSYSPKGEKVTVTIDRHKR